MEDKEGFPPIIKLMGGRFWPAVVAFFYSWHGISRVDAMSTFARQNSRVRIIPPPSQFDVEIPARLRRDEEDVPPRIYKPGEWASKVRSSPIWPSEKKFLGLFYQAKDNPDIRSIKGAGEEVPSRLVARGYLEEVPEPSDSLRWQITPEGEAFWLSISIDERN